MRLFLAAGARLDPHKDHVPFESPLVAAVANGHLQIVQVLVEAGANPWLQVNVSGRTAETYAVLHGHFEILDYLSRLKRHDGAGNEVASSDQG